MGLTSDGDKSCSVPPRQYHQMAPDVLTGSVQTYPPGQHDVPATLNTGSQANSPTTSRNVGMPSKTQTPASHNSQVSQETSRINGFKLPLHHLQIISWSILIVLAIVYFTTIDFSINNDNLRPTFRILLIVVLLVHICFHVLTTFIDPSDPAVINKRLQLYSRGESNALPKFDRSKNNHVIENQYCSICQVKVCTSSKHCSYCNKCITGFDHHCKWLNNCIGVRNYRVFLITLISGVLCAAIVGCMSLMVFIAFYTDTDTRVILKQYHDAEQLFRSSSRMNDSSLSLQNNIIPSNIINNISSMADFRVFLIPSASFIWLIVVFIEMVLSILSFLLLAHLLSFHIYINIRGFTTYEFIVNGRKQKKSAPTNDAKSKARCNRITPQTSEYELNSSPYIGRPTNAKLQDYIRSDKVNKDPVKNNINAVKCKDSLENKVITTNNQDTTLHSISNLILQVDNKRYVDSVDTTPPLGRKRGSYSDLDDVTLDGSMNYYESKEIIVT